MGRQPGGTGGDALPTLQAVHTAAAVRSSRYTTARATAGLPASAGGARARGSRAGLRWAVLGSAGLGPPSLKTKDDLVPSGRAAPPRFSSPPPAVPLRTCRVASCRGYLCSYAAPRGSAGPATTVRASQLLEYTAREASQAGQARSVTAGQYTAPAAGSGCRGGTALAPPCPPRLSMRTCGRTTRPIAGDLAQPKAQPLPPG